jgi:hypothetical protein
MKLKELLAEGSRFSREVPIGVETEIMGEPALILGLAQTKPAWGRPPGNRIFLLHQMDAWGEEDWDEDDDEFDDNELTFRHFLMSEVEANAEPDFCDVKKFIVGDREFPVHDSEEFFMDDENHFFVLLLKNFVQAGKVPLTWLNKDTEDLCVTEYEVGQEIYDVNWNADILKVRVEMEELPEEILVGEVFQCNCGHYDIPEKVRFEGKEGTRHEHLIHGLVLFNPWENIEDPEVLMELEDYFAKTDRLLVLEYETKEDFHMQFYTKDYLDTQAEMDVPISGSHMHSPNDEIRRCVLDIVSKDFDETVEIELFSYYE